MSSANTTALMIRCTDAQRRGFERRAEVEGLSVSAWARMILVREVSRGQGLSKSNENRRSAQ